MKLQIEGKVALVCAASAGIGKAIAMGLAQEGARVAILARNPERLAEASAEIHSKTGIQPLQVVCDLSKVSDIDQALMRIRGELGEVDILVNNQGGPKVGAFEAIEFSDLEQAWNTGLVSVFHLLKACLPSMKTKGWGRVVNILSISAKETLPNMLLSNTLRPAVLGLTKTLALEYAASGITINSLLPASVLTDRSRGMIQARADREGKSFADALKDSEGRIPAGRLASPEEFAQTALFLCGNPASYVTGTAIPVDGGFHKGLH